MSERLIGIDSSSQVAPHSSSPVHRLLPELLHIIFDAARRDPPSTAPFTLSHVCHTWRAFLLTSPSLWTTLIAGHSPACRFEYYNLWFQRSQKLDLSLYVRPVGCGLTNGDFIYILSIPDRSWKVIEFAETIRYIEEGFQNITASLIIRHIPKLRKLYVPKLKIQFHQSKTDRLTSLGNLESLAIHAGFLTLSPKFFSTCSRLRQIYLGYHDNVGAPVRLTSLYHTIQHVSPQLEDLRIQIYSEVDRIEYGDVPRRGPVYPLESPSDVILTPRLKELDLSWGSNNSQGHFFSALLRKLCTPNLVILRNFAVFVLGEEEEFTPPGLTHLELTGRILGNTAFPKTSIHAFFRTFSQLSNLRSVEFKFITWHGGEFATALLDSCPQLVRVSLHTCFSVREADLRRLVEGRKVSEGMACLQYLGVANCHALVLDAEARTWFRAQLNMFDYKVGVF